MDPLVTKNLSRLFFLFLISHLIFKLEENNKSMATEPQKSYYLAHGFRFNPTDEELVRYYLRRKVEGQTLEDMAADVIKVTDLYGDEPKNIYAHLKISDYTEFYFFTEVKKKFSCTSKANRAAGTGTWKVQGHKKDIWNLEQTDVIGYMDTLNFQINNRNCNPSWIMHEYTLPGTENLTKYWALCRIKRNWNNSKIQMPLAVDCQNIEASEMAKLGNYVLAPGFRFNPTDQELVGHYLCRRVGGQPLELMAADVIKEKDLYSAAPKTIYGDLNISEYEELYFFTEVEKKFSNKGQRFYMNRVAGYGTWKVQDHRKDIWNLDHTEVIGNMDMFNFQIDNKNCNPSWIMHEYTLPDSEHLSKFWAICRIKRNITGSKSIKHKRPLLVDSNGDGNFCQPNKKQCLEHCRNIEASTSHAQPTSDMLHGMAMRDIRVWCNRDVEQNLDDQSLLQLQTDITAPITSSTELPAHNDYTHVDDLYLQEVGNGSFSSALRMAMLNTDGLQYENHYHQEGLSPEISEVGGQEVCPSSELTTLPQPTQLSISSIEVPAELLDQCGNSRSPEEDSSGDYPETGFDINFLADFINFPLSSNNECPFEEADNSVMMPYHMWNPYIESYAGIMQ